MVYQPQIGQGDDYILALYTCLNSCYGMHWHTAIELCYCLNGSVTIGVEGVVHTVNPGELIIINSGEQHSFNIKNDSEALIIEMGYEILGLEFQDMAKNIFSHRVINLLSNDDYSNIREVFEKIVELRIVKMQHENWRIRSALIQLAVYLTEEVGFSSEKPSSSLIARRRDMGNVMPALNLIQNRYMEPLKVEDMALECGYESNSFCRLFKYAMGESPHSYLNNYRVSKAKILLQSSNYSVIMVGEMCGFPENKSFTRNFKKQTGMSPKAYRDSFKAQAEE